MQETFVVIPLDGHIPVARYNLKVEDFPQEYNLQNVYSLLQGAESNFRKRSKQYIIYFREGIFLCNHQESRRRKGSSPSRKFKIYDLLDTLGLQKEHENGSDVTNDLEDTEQVGNTAG